MKEDIPLVQDERYPSRRRVGSKWDYGLSGCGTQMVLGCEDPRGECPHDTIRSSEAKRMFYVSVLALKVLSPSKTHGQGTVYGPSVRRVPHELFGTPVEDLSPPVPSTLTSDHTPVGSGDRRTPGPHEPPSLPHGRRSPGPCTSSPSSSPSLHFRDDGNGPSGTHTQ